MGGREDAAVARLADLLRRWPGHVEALVRVGVVWQGNVHFAWDHWRSVPLEQFAALGGVEGVELVSLQKGAGERPAGGAARAVHDTRLEGLDGEGGAFGGGLDGQTG